MPQTVAEIDAANRTHPTTRILPTDEQLAEQRRERLKVAAIAAAAGVGALALAGGIWYAYRAGWLGSPPPKRFAWRALDAARSAAAGGLETARTAALDSLEAARCAASSAYEGATSKIKAW